MFAAALVLLLSGAEARAVTVAVVMSRQIPPYEKALDGFKKELECDIVKYDLQQRKNDEEVAKEIIAGKPNLVLAIGSRALKLSKKFIKDTPVIFTMVLIPGSITGNIAGVSMMIPAKNHLEGLKFVAPEVKSVGIVYNPARSEATIKEFREAAKELEINIVAIASNSKKEAFSNIKLLGGRVDALWMVMDKDVVSNFNLLQSVAVKDKIPLATFSYKYVEMGALLALAPKFEALGKQAAEIGKELIAGTPASKIGIVSPSHFFYAFNVKTALKIGVGVPSEQSMKGKEFRMYQ